MRLESTPEMCFDLLKVARCEIKCFSVNIFKQAVRPSVLHILSAFEL